VKVNPSKRFYAQIGAFEANRSLIPSNGFDFSTKADTGVMTAIEVGLQSASPLADHAYHVRLGGYRNSSPVSDPFLNTRGISRVQFKGAPLQHLDGQTGWYAMGDVVLTRLGTDRRRNVTLFGGSIGAGEDYTIFRNQTILGAVVTGAFASRPEDTFGIVGSYIQLGPKEVDFLQTSRRAAGGTDTVRKAEGIFEINYGFKIARGIKANPNIQYIVNPDNILKPAAVHQSKNILAFGLRLSVEVGAVLGFPVWR
jgi:porin